MKLSRLSGRFAALLLTPTCLVLFVLALRTVVSADPPAVAREAQECRWVDEPLTLDGKADEAAWKTAKDISNFGRPWLGRDAAAVATTHARLLWGREFLHFFADLDDTDLNSSEQLPDGMEATEDLFELYLKPAADKPGYFVLRVNAAGKTHGVFLPARVEAGKNPFKSDNLVEFETVVQRRGTLNQKGDRDTGWSVEGRVRWRELLRAGGRPNVNETWQFALCRTDVSADGREPQFSTTALLTRADAHRYEDYAALRFLSPSASLGSIPPALAQRVPLTTSRVVGSPEPPAPYTVRRAFPKLELTNPIGVIREPDSNRLLLIHQASAWSGKGRIVRISDDPEVTQAEDFLAVDGIAYGIAFHPNFAKNGYFYVGWNGPHDKKPRKVAVTRYTLDRQPPYKIIPGSGKEIISWVSNGHNGGDLAFDRDGMLLVTSGDGTSDSDTDLTGQDVSSLLAKVLRIDVDHPEPGKAYSIPKDNPFVGREGTRPETWAYGFRNPWRIHVDPATGDIWVGQNGQDTWEQVYLIEKGANYGWSVMEGGYPFYLNRKRGPDPISPPLIDHPHSEFRSLTGGVVYHGDKLPELRGTYIYGDFSTGKIWGARVKDRKLVWHQELVDTTLQVTGFGLDSHGELLIADHGGGYYYLEKAPPPDPSVAAAFPRKLSETGLFRSVKGHQVQPALIPYSVNAQLWSDGAYKERYIALPGEDPRIDISPNRGWNFPDRAVIVKSFALETKEGDPASRRWIETRLLTKQEGEWVGYSYLWNDEQTDATLVEAKGTDREYTIRTADGERKQTWRYPSRTECMVCHTRASNYVLGLSTSQMNKIHDYDGVKLNQLRMLEHLGVLRFEWLTEARNGLKADAKRKKLSEKAASAWTAVREPAKDQREPVKSSLLPKAPDQYSKLVDPFDATQDLEARARSYLHSNCAICHVEAGGGNSMMELEFSRTHDKMQTIDVPPNHHTFDLKDARLIAPGHPERSTLLHRISIRGANQMPPLATSQVDREAVKLLEAWIRELKPTTVPMK